VEKTDLASNASASRLVVNMDNARHTRRPIVGITADIASEKLQVGCGYARMIAQAGGLPIVLPCEPELADELLAMCDGVVLTGGDDPIMSHWGRPMHPKAKALNPQRQEFELALLRGLDSVNAPALGVCLGMQLMGLHHGGALDQHLPDTLPTAAQHWEQGTHEVDGELGSGRVHSHHRQALSHAGGLAIIARSPDGVIEAVASPARAAMYLGVQWHPERTEDPRLGLGLFEKLVREARDFARERR
jgi:putative glutamine amidotransferase